MIMSSIKLNPYEIATIQLFLALKKTKKKTKLKWPGPASSLYHDLWNQPGRCRYKVPEGWVACSRRWGWTGDAGASAPVSSTPRSVVFPLRFWEQVKVITVTVALKAWPQTRELCVSLGKRRTVIVVSQLITGNHKAPGERASSSYLHSLAKR